MTADPWAEKRDTQVRKRRNPARIVVGEMEVQVNVRGAWEVRAGLVPGTSMEEFHKLFHYTVEMFDQDNQQDKSRLPAAYTRLSNYLRVQAEAMAYFRQLNEPALLNWAEITWIWY